MKSKYTFTACLLGLGALVSLNAQEVKFNAPGQTAAPAVAAPAAPAATFTKDQILETWGWALAQNAGIPFLQFTPDEVAAVSRGMTLAAKGSPPPDDVKAIAPQVEAFFKQRQDLVLGQLRDKGRAEQAKFFTDLKQNPKVTILPDGLGYEILQPGAGAYPKPDQTVKVNYEGRLLNGTTFDSSYERKAPAEFVVNQVIPGWAEGIQKINKGGKIRLYVPSDLAYGDDGHPGIPPESGLIFDIELLDVKDTPPAAPAAAAPVAAPQPQ